MQTLWNRSGWIAATVLSLFVVGAMTGVVRGGPLDPPGPPGSTDSVQLPGTPISSVPFTISAPGNYYLTRDLGYNASGAAITVATDDATIDLMGFTIHSNSGSGTAIYAPTFSRLTVRNGRINVFPIGIANTNGVYGRFEDLAMQMNGTSGDAIETGDHAVVSNVDTFDGNTAISVGKSARVSGVSASEPSVTGISAGDGAQISDAKVVGGYTGVQVNDDALLTGVQVIGAIAYGLVGSSRVTVLDCTVTTGTLSSANVLLAHYGTVRGCSVAQGGSLTHGIEVGSFGLVEDNAIRNAGYCAIQFDGEHARANNNQIAQAQYAVCALNPGAANAVYNNSYTGISVGIYFGPGGSLQAGPMASADTATNPFTNITQ